MTAYPLLSGMIQARIIHAFNGVCLARALQENIYFVQHHIHHKKSDSQQHTIPNACLSSKSAKACNTGFRMDTRLHFHSPVLLSKDLAKKRTLPWKGRRSVLSQMLGKRYPSWLHGTAPGLAIALSGSNFDVKINNLLPMAELTHENSTCNHTCIPTAETKRNSVMRRLALRVSQSRNQRNAYSCGNICKQQKYGKLEARRCIEKLLRLRELHKERSEYQQHRAVSGRLITDIEMNATIHGAI